MWVWIGLDVLEERSEPTLDAIPVPCMDGPGGVRPRRGGPLAALLALLPRTRRVGLVLGGAGLLVAAYAWSGPAGVGRLVRRPLRRGRRRGAGVRGRRSRVVGPSRRGPVDPRGGHAGRTRPGRCRGVPGLDVPAGRGVLAVDGSAALDVRRGGRRRCARRRRRSDRRLVAARRWSGGPGRGRRPRRHAGGAAPVRRLHLRHRGWRRRATAGTEIENPWELRHALPARRHRAPRRSGGGRPASG